MTANLSDSWVMVLIDTATGLKKRELDWLLEELHETLKNLKHGLEDCYALLAPVDPGSTLVLTTPRNEIVKGTVTRVGTRIVKGVSWPPPCSVTIQIGQVTINNLFRLSIYDYVPSRRKHSQSTPTTQYISPR